MIGGLICVIPGFLLTLVVSFVTCDVVIRILYGQPGGTYHHYFVEFLTPGDIAASLLKATVYCTAVTLIHCYYGFFASGGPVGVGGEPPAGRSGQAWSRSWSSISRPPSCCGGVCAQSSCSKVR